MIHRTPQILRWQHGQQRFAGMRPHSLSTCFPFPCSSSATSQFCCFWTTPGPTCANLSQIFTPSQHNGCFLHSRFKSRTVGTALPNCCPLLQPLLRRNVPVMWLRFPFWLPTTIFSLEGGNCTMCVLVFPRAAAATGDVTVVSIATYCFSGHPTPSALPGARRLHPCPVILDCGGVAVPRLPPPPQNRSERPRVQARGWRGGRSNPLRRVPLPARPLRDRSSPALSRPLLASAPKPPSPGAAPPRGVPRPARPGEAAGGRGLPSLPARKMAAERRGGGGSPSGRRGAQRAGAGGPRPA